MATNEELPFGDPEDDLKRLKELPPNRGGKRHRKNVGSGNFDGDPEKGGQPKGGKRRKPAPLHKMTTELLEASGYVVGRVERFNAFSGKKLDLFGVADMIAIRAASKGRSILFAQACKSDRRSDHMKTITKGEHTRTILESGAEIPLVSWRRADVGKTTRWEYAIEFITLDMLGKDVERFKGEWRRLADDKIAL
jgi:hypothetical protein